MKKTFMMLVLTVLGVALLVGCEDSNKLTRIDWTGIDDVMDIAFGSDFNVLTGVKAVGNDGVDYTAEITFNSTATISETGVLDTQTVGSVGVKYSVKVDEFVSEKWRYFEVLNPEAVEGQMLINADFEQGTGGWTDPSVNYVADGAEMTITADNGTLKVDVVAGTNAYTPRFGQMNVPFENGKTYEISFKAKSSVEKTINLQVGELLSGAPYFTDFKPGLAITKTITTEWATYSYKFTMNQAEENKRGGILFELGTVGGQAIDATIWFDDVEIKEAVADPDTTAPTFAGLATERTVLLNGTFDPLAGVTAFDIVDGDVTDLIEVVIENASQEVVTVIDTTVETTYTITYTVSDEAGNEAEFVLALSVVGMQFNDQNLLVNGDFEAALGETPEWSLWLQDWDTAAVATFNIVEGVAVVDIANLGSQPDAWSIQFTQKIAQLVEGKTYRASFDIKSSVDRDINFVLTNPNIGYYEYTRANGLAVTSDWTTYEFVFTAKQTSELTNFEFDLGNSANAAVGVVSIDNVKLQEAIMDELLVNTNFDDQGFYLWAQDWGTPADVTYTENDAHVLDIVAPGDNNAAWTIQFNQDNIALENGKTYELKFDVSATAARDMNVKIFIPNPYTPYLEQLGVAITTDVVSHTFEFTVSEASHDGLLLSFELGTTEAYAAGVVTLDNISLKEKVAEAPELVVNGMAGNPVLYWTYDNAGGGEGSMVRVDGEAVISVTALGEAYQPHLYQMLDGLKAGTYVLKVVVTSDVDRDLRVNMVVPNWGYASILPDTKVDFDVVAGVEKVVTVEFTVATDIADPVKFEFDFGTLGGELTSVVGNFTISEILLYQVVE